MLVTRGYVQWQCRTPHLECLLSTTMQMDFSSLGVAAFISFIHLHFMKPEGIASNRSAMLSAKSTSRRKNPCTAIQAIETPTKKGTSKKWKVLQGAQGHSTSSKWQQQGAKQRELRAIHHNRLTFQRLSAGSNMKAHTKKEHETETSFVWHTCEAARRKHMKAKHVPMPRTAMSWAQVDQAVGKTITNHPAVPFYRWYKLTIPSHGW